MADDNQSADSFNIPSWVPPPVVDTAKALRIHFVDRRDDLAVLDRIVSDDRMDMVWKELLKRKKGASTEFFYSAHVPSIESDDDAAHHSGAMAALFYYAMSLALSGPKVVTVRELENIRGKLLDESEMLKRAAELLRVRGPGRVATNSAAGAADGAQARKAESDQLAKAKTRLIVKRDTGDPQARCFAILFARRCEELFGTEMHGVTARVASVALGRTITQRAVRGWCEHPADKGGS
jgi:hypothetical protein